MERFRELALGAVVATASLATPLTYAGSIQSLGVSEECVAMGGACVATSDDMGAYYSNPSGAAQFENALFGLNLRVIDTTYLKLIDSDGSHEVPRTNKKGKVALAPSAALYLPIAEGTTVGIALGAPFALSGDWPNKDGVHRYNMADQSLFLLDLSPLVAYQVSDRLAVGMALNITALKQLRLETLIPDTFLTGLALGQLANPTPNSPIVGSVTLETEGDVHLGIPPDGFSSSFEEGTFTVGLQYKVTERLKFGATYRHITKTTWDGEATFALPLLQGSNPQKTRFEADVDLPGHAQIGMALMPSRVVTWTLDAQRTFWSRTRGFGSPAEVEFGQPLLGMVDRLVIDYSARDAMTYRTGLKYQVHQGFSLMFGYAYDERMIDDEHIDVLTYDSIRHIVSFGAKFDLREITGEGWSMVASFQDAHYATRRIDKGESENLGGVSQPNLSDGNLRFVPNTEAFTFAGDIPSLSLSMSYSF